jgi:hypothetical protein
VEDAKELAEQAAVLYVSIGKSIDPSLEKEELQSKRGDIALVIKFASSLEVADFSLNISAGL